MVAKESAEGGPTLYNEIDRRVHSQTNECRSPSADRHHNQKAKTAPLGNGWLSFLAAKKR